MAEARNPPAKIAVILVVGYGALAPNPPYRFASHDQSIGRQRQERRQRVGDRQVAEQLDRLGEAAGGIVVGADLALHPLHLLAEQLVEEFGRHLLAVFQLGVEMQLLPDLRAADLGGGGILHQIVERHRAAAPQPRLDILHADADVLAQALLGARAFVDFEQFLLADVDVLAQLAELVGLRHQPVEHLHRHRHQVGMRDPGAVMAGLGLALLVGAHLGEGDAVDLLVAPVGDLRRHAAHGEGAAAVAGPDQQLRIGVEEGPAHDHLAAVGQQVFRLVPERLDEGEDVVPAAAVEAGHVVAQFVEDLVHLEGGRQRLDQHGRLDGADGDAERLLGMDEDLVPQPRLEMALQLGQVEIGAGAAGEQRLGVVEEIEAEIEQAAGDRLAVDDEMVLRQMPAARAHEQHGRLGGELVVLAARRVGEIDLAGPAVLEVDLALDLVGPGRRVGVLEIGHEDLGAGIERVDDHLAVDRPGDLDPPVEEIGGDRRHRPVAVADMGRLGQEVRQRAGVETGLALLAQAQAGAGAWR